MRNNPHSGKGWRKLATQRVRIGEHHDEPCYRCGKAIDWQASKGNKLAPTAEHIYALVSGGNLIVPLEELAVSHHSCNASHGATVKEAAKRRTNAHSESRQDKKRRAVFPDRPVLSRASRTFLSPIIGDVVTEGDVAVQREAVPPSLDPTLGGLDAPPSDANMPRLFSNPHPSAVHSWGYDCIKWIETTRGVTLRWSQKLVIVRALEVDVGGEFCWRDVVVLQPRRGGKTVILREVAMWRASHAHLFNEPQNILHLSKDLRLSRQTMSSVWPDYCPSHGLEVRRSNGQESVLWPDTSAWRLMTHGGSYGHEAGLLLADEGWALSPQHVEEAMEPCLIDRSMPQIWFFSMAHAEATALLVERRRMAVDPDNRVLLAEWSADPGIDLDDVGEWLGVPPHKSVSVVRDYRLAQRRRPRGFREQWLNMWPDVGSDGQSEWPPGWGAAPVVDGDVPPPGGVGALESSFDRRFFSVSVVVSVGDSSHVWTRRVGSQDEAVAVLVGWDPVRVFVGASLFAHVGMPIETEPMGGKETRLATAMFAEMVRRGLVAHNHDVDMGDQVVVARTAEHESGITLSAKASKGPTDQLRSVMWAFYGRSLPSLVEEAAIW